MILSSPVLTTGSDSTLYASYLYDSNSETGGLNGYFALQTKFSFLPLFSQRKKPGPHLTLSGVAGGSSSQRGLTPSGNFEIRESYNFHSKTRMTSVSFSCSPAASAVLSPSSVVVVRLVYLLW